MNTKEAIKYVLSATTLKDLECRAEALMIARPKQAHIGLRILNEVAEKTNNLELSCEALRVFFLSQKGTKNPAFMTICSVCDKPINMLDSTPYCEAFCDRETCEGCPDNPDNYCESTGFVCEECKP